MSIRHGLLALLEGGPRYGYQLRTEFESRTGSTWPLNVGQVYTTLGRLERDGLVAPAGEDGAGHALYAITDPGRAELHAWLGRPVESANPPRDEPAIKLAMAVCSPGADPAALIRSQRERTSAALREWTRLRDRAGTDGRDRRDRPNGPNGPEETARLLVLERLILAAEAELRWLELCADRLADGRAAVPSASDGGREG
ncbi:PadR family transcriptional regulator [Streptomyces sp. NPDC026673]|uniref:PadR family transcriptional regulator n=1 Tax=Streptomyces sp. NPDC026673 TaxID=3155724 RepID=UPI0033E47CA3